MKIRKAKEKDLKAIKNIFEIAKKKMMDDGNSFQWNKEDYPYRLVFEDMDKGNCYVIEDDNKNVEATFTVIVGDDPCYKLIDGRWLNDMTYCTIHRMASSGKIPHVFNIVVDYVKKNLNMDIRIDTYQSNYRMRHLIEKYGFTYCGTVFMKDGSPRLAYQLLNNYRM